MESDIRDVVTDEVFNSIKFLYSDLTNYRVLRKFLKLPNLMEFFI